jgi:IrrE N-terminal-like domain
MSVVFNARAVAAEIISSSGRSSPTFPRDIEFSVLSMPVHVELIMQLTPNKIAEWLQRHLKWPLPTIADNRRLRGCLVAHRGHAFIFLEASESVEERRFTLSHELAHFIGHYLAAREFAIARLGSSIASVLDGDRDPTSAERLSGVLARCPLGIFRDVLDRDGSEPLTANAERMESEADTAAFLALAPPGDVKTRCEAANRRSDRDGLLQTLQTDFGLARADAVHHLPVVLQFVRRQIPTLVESLKAAAAENGKPLGRSI